MSDPSPHDAATFDSVLASVEARRDEALADLSTFLRIPSISADPARRADVNACAQWLAERLNSDGLTARVEPTPGHPIVLARNEHRPGRPTVLLYGHYDVQPVDPVEQWTSPPFEPVVRKTAAGTDALYARGATDDKGQIWAHVEAINAWQRHGGLPVNLIALLEGEEEIDSHHLLPFITSHRDQLQADIALISDTNCFARGLPAITTGLRGLVYSEVTVRLAAHDLHSGIHGGAVRNPAIALAGLLASLHDESGRVTVPGFYDAVARPRAEERRAWNALPFDEHQYAAGLGLAEGNASLGGEAEYSTLERRWIRPTCDVCGITAGYQGPGAKTIIPASATAKVSFRLVPNQNAQHVRDAFERFVRDQLSSGFAVDVVHFATAPAVSVPTDGPWVQAARQAVERGFGVAPVLIRDGLTIPVVNLLRRELGIDTLLVGFGLPDDRPHAPDEKIDIDSFRAGARTAAVLYGLLGQVDITRAMASAQLLQAP